MQLGGPRVMGVNGVSHHVVADDLEGVTTILRLLGYAPPMLGTCPAVLPSHDPTDRTVTYCPGHGEKLDARAAIAGACVCVCVWGGAQTVPSRTARGTGRSWMPGQLLRVCVWGGGARREV